VDAAAIPFGWDYANGKPRPDVTAACCRGIGNGMLQCRTMGKKSRLVVRWAATIRTHVPPPQAPNSRASRRGPRGNPQHRCFNPGVLNPIITNAREDIPQENLTGQVVCAGRWVGGPFTAQYLGRVCQKPPQVQAAQVVANTRA